MSISWDRRSLSSQTARGGIWSRPTRPIRPAPPSTELAPPPPLGALLKEFKTDDFEESAKQFAEKAVISECSVIASYNWLDTREPTILIPGRPPRWTPPRETVRLREDSGTYFRDKNAARYPEHPLEPAIVAGLNMAPEHCRKGAADIVACGSTLGNLLRFVRGQDKSFRMIVEMVEGSVFFVRRENSPTDVIPDVRGFGHTFPERYTTWDKDVQGSTSHERLLRYSFGGLQLLVRFGADGYIEDPKLGAQESNSSTQAPKAEATASFSSSAVSDLIASLGDTHISGILTAGTKLSIQSRGSIVDQSGIFDLKTRSSRKKQDDTMGEELPRCWVAQIPKFILAYHDWGLFKEIQVLDIRDKVNEWEKSHQEALSRLAALIHRIIALLRENSQGKFELVHDGRGVLEVREALPGTTSALSPAVKTMWIAGSQASEEEKADTPEEDDIFEWKADAEEDFTACSASCGYCGRCAS